MSGSIPYTFPVEELILPFFTMPEARKNPFGGKNALPLQGYFDDSGNNPNERYFLWAGFLGGGKTFGELSEAWVAILSEGTPIGAWHTYSAHSHKDGELYLDKFPITKAELLEKEARLAALLAGFGGKGAITKAAVRIDRAEHKKHVVDALKAKPAKNNPLGVPAQFVESLERLELLPLHEVVRGMASVAIRLGQYADYCQIVFEDREGGADWQDSVCQSVRVFRRLEEPEFRKKIGAVTFFPAGARQDIRLPPLEAADLLAWHVRRSGIKGAEMEPCWPCFEMIEGPVLTVSTADMDRYVARLQAGERPWKIMKDGH